MKHLRDDYNRIQDPAGKIGEDEPVFLLRAQDKALPAMLSAYCAWQRAVGDDGLSEFIERQMPAVHARRERHPTKRADVPADALPGLPALDAAYAKEPPNAE